MTDGSSNTMAVAECLLGQRTAVSGPLPGPREAQRLAGTLSGSPIAGGPGLSGVFNPDLSAFAASCTSWQGERGFGWIVGKPVSTTFSAYLSPNSPVPDMARHGIGARSSHPGGVHAALGDGSVRFLADSIELDVWRALATCAGGEVVGRL